MKNGHKGFQIPQRTARLKFEGDYDGAEVVVRLGISLRAFFDLSRLTSGDDVEAQQQAFTDFSERVLLEWNLEDDGTPVPLSLLECPVEFAVLVVKEYLAAVPNVPLATASSEA